MQLIKGLSHRESQKEKKRKIWAQCGIPVPFKSPLRHREKQW